MYEGRYSGHMQPMEHYIPLKQDFSNIDAGVTIRAPARDGGRFRAAVRSGTARRAARRARSEVGHAVDRVYLATPAPIVEALATIGDEPVG